MGQGFETVTDNFARLKAWSDLAGLVASGHSAQVAGLAGGLPGLVVAALARGQRPVLVVSPDWREAQALAGEAAEWLAPGSVALLPPRPQVMGEVRAEGHEWDRLRMAAFSVLDQLPGAVVVAPVEAVRQLVPSRRRQELAIARGDRLSREAAIARLVDLGYERLPLVEQPGQFAARGPILDIYPVVGPALRVEWFDDEVDLLVELDPATQRNGAALEAAVVGPSRELLWTPEERDRAIARITRELDEAVAGLVSAGHRAEADALSNRWAERLALLLDNRGWPGMERAAAAFGTLVPVTAWFPLPPVVVLDDRERVLEAARGRAREEAGERQRRLERGDLLPLECETSLEADALPQALRGHAVVDLSLLPHHHGAGRASLVLAARPAPRAHGQWDLLVTELRRLLKARHRVLISVKSDEAAQHLVGRLVEAGVPVARGITGPSVVGVAVGRLTRGFVLPEMFLAVLSEAELTGRAVHPEPVGRRSVAGHALLQLAELQQGDYVVHVTHGIGRFLGVRTLEAGGVTGDYLHIAYAGDDALYVPVDQLDVVQRYAGGGDAPPKLSRLGGAEWSRAKERVKASVRDMAEQLLALYAARESRPGFAFGPDTPWQQDFEDAFPYEETADQLKATEEIKRDMERPRPMDRLLLGDVGYGKTEVALRAVFKAIMAGKQAAVLVPTTLLGEQHYSTARARMAGFPINIGVMSRFQSPKEQRDTLAALADGRLDLVVGTHRLLSADVKFKNLGLLVVDEEHRFGVAHKERIKALNETVDVLTLSATPIPRTLNMAMIGVRDWSVLETPPEQRFPVETVVAEFDDHLIREAIRRELERDGQVYYVQNRIRAMDFSLARIKRLVPDARIAVAHGQMDETRLEDVMTRFVAGEYDVLLATSIIESGLDIPNVNTLVVEDADRLGLAQLYQLRGRVGRSFRLAYAYFTVRQNTVLTVEAERRLAAIHDFTELGAGYQIALRDLEIRGAGNLLGAEQHGFVAMVGFELYTQLLADAIRELKGEPTTRPVETSLEFGVEAYLPGTYIEDERQKIALYKRLVSATTAEDVNQVAEEMEERFGPMPPAADTLVRLARIRVAARRLGLAQVTRRADRVVLRLGDAGRVDGDAVAALGRRYPGRLVQMPARVPELGFRLDPRAGEDVLALTENVLNTLLAAASAAAEREAPTPLGITRRDDG